MSRLSVGSIDLSKIKFLSLSCAQTQQATARPTLVRRRRGDRQQARRRATTGLAVYSEAATCVDVDKPKRTMQCAKIHKPS